MSDPVGGNVGAHTGGSLGDSAVVRGRDTPVRLRGVRLGVDLGTVRVGVAVSDPHGILATPLDTLARDARDDADLDRLAVLVAQNEVVEVVVGLPRTLQGADGPAAIAARAYGRALAERIAPVPVVFVDERMTTAIAHRSMAAGGLNSRARRSLVDQQAAVTILQSRLDQVRAAR